jgi:hypothetical protein
LSAGGLIAENGWFAVSSPSGGSTAQEYRLVQNVVARLYGCAAHGSKRRNCRALFEYGALPIAVEQMKIGRQFVVKSGGH